MFKLDRQSIDTASMRLSYFEVPWDTEIFGSAVAQLEGFELRQPQEAGEDFQTYQAWGLARGLALEVCKLDPRRLTEIAWLQARGFRWVETMYFPAFTRLQALPAPEIGKDLKLRAMRAEELPVVQSLAAEAFVTSRFLIDPEICPRRGGERYSVWVRNSAADPAQQLLVAEVEGRMAGFFIVQEREQAGVKQAYWHLTAVAPEFQGKGLGKRLWLALMHWHREHGCAELRTAVSGHNLPVLGLYGQLGFRFERAETTLHRGGLPPLVAS